MATQSQRLRRIIALANGRLTELVEKAWTHPRLPELFPEFLFATFGVTRASAPLLRAASARAAELGRADVKAAAERAAAQDPLAAKLAEYYAEHAEEECGHELWLLDDLTHFGVPCERALARFPYPGAAALVGAQYYWALHVHPVALLGYLAVVESPPALDFLEEISESRGIPLAAMSTHVRHARLDADHIAAFDAMLDELPLEAAHRDLISVSAMTSIAHLEQIFADLLQRFDRAVETAGGEGAFMARAESMRAAPQEAAFLSGNGVMLCR